MSGRVWSRRKGNIVGKISISGSARPQIRRRGLPFGSSAGKSTLAHLISERLRQLGCRRIEILDGDVIRTNLCKDLGFSREDRNSNIRRIAFGGDSD